MFTWRKKVGYVIPLGRKLQFEALERRNLLSATNPRDLLAGSLPTSSPADDGTPPASPMMQYYHIVNYAAINGATIGVASDAGSSGGSSTASSSTPNGSSAPVGYTPTQLRTAYGVSQLSVGANGGAGQTIAIIDTYDDPALVSSTHPSTDSAFAASDFGKFDAAMGLPDPPSFLKVNEHGATSPLPAASGGSGWSVEESLDVEWAHAMAPAANIILIECSTASDADLVSAPTAALGTATSLTNVSVVSMSFGRSENSTDTTLDSDFSTPNGHTPITYCASTGDSGAPGGYPADSPNVVAVGGTTLNLSGNTYVSETGWADGGGGQSVYETKPSYQQGVQTSTAREIPDVSSDANPSTGVAVYDSYDYGSSTPWAEIGGTSVSSPCWAGLISISNQLRVNSGLSTLNGRNDTLPSLYNLYKNSTSYSNDFHDITVGSNGYPAGTGYDMVTGIGSPKANSLMADLVGVSNKGTVGLSASSYAIGTSATVTVADLNQLGQPSVTVTMTSSAGDSETLTLAAQGGGVFKGSISLSAGSVVQNDGVLETVAGGTITATYADVNWGGQGQTVNVTAQATTYMPVAITGTTPGVGGSFTLPGPFTYDVNFSEAVLASSVTTHSLTVSGIPGATVSGVTLLNGNTTARFTLSGTTTDGTLTATIAAGAITDPSGNPNLAFSGTYYVDLGTTAFPIPLSRTTPAGSLIYSNTSSQHFINPDGKQGAFTISIDPNQTITVLVAPSGSTLQPSVQLLDPSNTVIGAATAAAAGQDALLQTVATDSSTPGTYTIVVGGASSTSGGYTVQLTLNAALEREGTIAGATDNTLATAQDLTASFLTLGGQGSLAQRGAVVGQTTVASTPDYYSFTAAAGDVDTIALATVGAGSLSLALLNSSGATLATGTTGATNLSNLIGDYQVAAAGTYYVQIEGAANIAYSLLVTRNAAFATLPNSTAATAQDIDGTQGVLGFVQPGATPNTVVPNSNATVEGNADNGYPFNIAYWSVATMRYQQIYSQSQFASGGTIDAIRFRRSTDGYGTPFSTSGINVRIDLGYAATTTSTISTTFANNRGNGMVTVYNGLLSLASNGTGNPNPFDIVINVAPQFTYNPALGNLLMDVYMYSSPATCFFDAASNTTSEARVWATNAAATTGTTDGYGFGLITRFDFLPAPSQEWYTVTASAGNALDLSTTTPSDGSGAFGNTLSPHVQLYDPTGTTLLASGAVGSDGRNETLSYLPTASGAYKVCVTSKNSTLGEYFLGIGTPIGVGVPANLTQGQGTVNGSLTVPTAPSSDLVVSLSSSDPARLTVPATVTIPAGQTSAPLPLTAIVDGFLHGPEAVTIVAAAQGYAGGAATVEVHDNLTAALSVSLPQSVAENTGTVTGSVTASAAPSQNVTIQLSSNDAAQLTVPATVVLPAGQTSVDFTATLIDNHVIGLPPVPVTVSAQMDNWTPGAGTTSVLDTDATLAVSLPASGWKGQTVAGTVTLGGTLTTPLTVYLSSSDTTRMTVPASVTVPAGQLTAGFTATLIDNHLNTGPETEAVTATASGLTTGSTNIVIDDSDLDHYTWTTIAGPETADVPFSVTVHACDVLGNTILVYNGAAALRGAGQQGALSVSPATITFVNGVWTGNVTVNAVDPTVTLTLNDGASHTGASNVFATQGGPVASFQWSTISNPQYAAWPTAATITAKDVHGFTATGFNGPVNLTAQNGPGTVTVGTGAGTWGLPLLTQYYDCRTQVIYEASDLGGAGPITSLALDVSTVPGQVMNGWTIRMQETPLNSYSTYSWAGSGWTTVYQANQTISATGWVTFNFTTPFYYDGAQNLMVDFSIHNTSYSSPGYSYYTYTSATRSIYYYTNGAYGDPKNWSGTTTPIYATYYVPNIRLNIGGSIGVTPTTTGNFTNGVWSGSVMLASSAVANAVYMTANDGKGHTGVTNTFTLLLQPALGLAAPTSVTEGVGTVTAWLGIPFALNGDLTVELVSSDPARLTAPATETIPAGQTLISFPITIVTTGLLDGPDVVTVTASATNFAAATSTITVHSNESATLSVSLPASALETDGPATGTVTASAAPAQNIVVQLASSSTSHLTVPATVTLPAGQTTVNFTATPVDDHAIEMLPMPVTVTASVDNWINGTTTIAILDNDHTISVTLPAVGWEGQTAAGTVTIGGTSLSPTTVALASSDTAKLTVPAWVTVPAGQLTASFTATLINNGLKTGPVTETVAATAGGFSPGSANIVVGDVNVDHYTFTAVSGPESDAVAFPVTVGAYDIKNNLISVYNGTAKLSAAGQGGALSVSPTTVTFASGTWTGNVTINGVDPAAVLTLNNGAGATGSSNSFVVQPGPVASFSWSTIANPQYTNLPFSASLTAKDANGYTATGYGGTATLSGGVGSYWTGTILGEPTPNWSGNYGAFTLGYTFTPTSTITVTDVLHDFGSKISIWTIGGTLLGSQTFSSSNQGWLDTPLTSPVQLTGGNTYVIADYSAGQTYYMWQTPSHTSPLGTLGQEREISGDGFPTGSYADDWWTVDLLCQVGTITKVPISPTAATFVNGVWSGNVTVTQAASNMHLHVDDGSGHVADSNTFDVVTVPLTLTVPANITQGDPAATGTVSIPSPLGSDLVVDLSSSDSARLTAPATVTIPAGQTSTTFPITAVVDGLLHGPEAVTMAAVAPGCVNGNATIEVHDNVTAVLSVTLPQSAAKNSGTVTGTVTASAAPAQNVTIQLSSGDTTRLTVPATVILLAGQTSVNFTATLIDNHIIEGVAAPVTVASTMDNWTAGSATISIQDTDATLAVSLPPSGWKGQTVSGTVTLGGTSSTPLTVYLSSSDTTRLTVPASLTVPPGQLTASFTATLIDNQLKTGPETESVTATASGLTSGSANIVIGDSDVDHYTFTTIASPQTDNVAFAVTAKAYDVENNLITVYNSTVPLSATGQSGTLSVTPATVTFASGVWMGNVTINGVDPAAVLTLNNGSGATGLSNSFAVRPGPIASFSWGAITSPQGVNIPFAASLTAKDVNGYTVTSYNGTTALSGSIGAGSTTILGEPSPTSSAGPDTFTLGYSFTPSSTITVTDVLHYYGDKVSIWTNSGTLVGSQTFPTASAGWVDTPMATPVQLIAGTTYRIADYTADQTYYYSINSWNSVSLGTVGAGCWAVGDAFPANIDLTYLYVVDLVARTSAPVAITPVSAAFVHGVWSGNITVSQTVSNMHLHMDDGAKHTADSNTFNVVPVTTAVVGRYVFYAGSTWDGNQPAPNANDDAAIAPDKTALLPGGTASFANYTSYSRGINGIMIDVKYLAGTPTASDFLFQVGNSNTPSSWAAAPAPTSITVRTDAGVGGASRIEIVWPNNAIQKEWLQVTVLADAHTGLTTNDVFYWGNAIGDTGDSPTDAYVNATDEILARHNSAASASITNGEDFNRDGEVDQNDVTIVQQNGTNFMTALKLITVPTAAVTGGDGPDDTTTVVASSAGTAVFGMPPVLTVAVSAPNSTGIPTGEVDFIDTTTGVDLGLALLNTSGQATLGAPALGVGTHGIVAEYSGDGTFTASASVPLSVTVLAAATWTGDGSDANWSTAANWGGVALSAGMPLSFSGAGGAAANDLTAMQANGIAFLPESGPFVLSGNAVSFLGTVNDASFATQTIAISLALTGSDAIFNSTSGVLAVSGNISSSGSYGIQKTGAATVILSGNNSYSGATTVVEGTLVVATDTALPSGTGLAVGDWGPFVFGSAATSMSTPSRIERIGTATAAPARLASSASSVASVSTDEAKAIASPSAIKTIGAAAASPLRPQAPSADRIFAAMVRAASVATVYRPAVRAAAAVLADCVQNNKDAAGNDAFTRIKALEAALAQRQ